MVGDVIGNILGKKKVQWDKISKNMPYVTTVRKRGTIPGTTYNKEKVITKKIKSSPQEYMKREYKNVKSPYTDFGTWKNKKTVFSDRKSRYDYREEPFAFGDTAEESKQKHKEETEKLDDYS